MCEIYGQNSWIVFFYEHGSPEVHVQEAQEKNLSNISIFLWLTPPLYTPVGYVWT